MRDYKNIKAWQLADDLAVAVYERTEGFPRREVYGLTSQVRRAACSCAANIAEGASRASKKDYLHFLYIARGSLAETEYFLHLSHRLKYIENSDHKPIQLQIQEAQACLYGLIKAVEKETHPLARTLSK